MSKSATSAQGLRGEFAQAANGRIHAPAQDPLSNPRTNTRAWWVHHIRDHAPMTPADRAKDQFRPTLATAVVRGPGALSRHGHGGEKCIEPEGAVALSGMHREDDGKTRLEPTAFDSFQRKAEHAQTALRTVARRREPTRTPARIEAQSQAVIRLSILALIRTSRRFRNAHRRLMVVRVQAAGLAGWIVGDCSRT